MINLDQSDEDADGIGDLCDGDRRIRGGAASCAAVVPAGGVLVLVTGLLGLALRRRVA